MYHAQTEVLKDFYAQRKLLRLVNGDQAITKITDEILEVIGARV